MALLVACSTTCWSTSIAAHPSVLGQVNDRIIITLESTVDVGKFFSLDKRQQLGANLPELAELVASKDASLSPLFPQAKTPADKYKTDLRLSWVCDFPAHISVAHMIDTFSKIPGVKAVYPVTISTGMTIPNDVNPSQWHLRNTLPGGKDIRAIGGWNETWGDTNMVIAIIDSGIDWQHPELGGPGPDHVNGSIWTNWAEYNGIDGYDDDHNGFMDDIRGWDWVTGVSGVPGEDVSTPDNDPSDWDGHGTLCAGCAVAVTDNGTGIAGTAPNCKVMALRAGWKYSLDQLRATRDDWVSQAMVYAVDNGARIISCSHYSSPAMAAATNYAIQNGVLIITCAGNSNNQEQMYFCQREDCYAVAATDIYDSRASWTSYGTWVDISAPGNNITSTSYNPYTGEHGFSQASGTSLSAPLTAGAAALVWSVHPDWTGHQVMDHLMATADNLDSLNPGFAGLLGAGRINLLRALGDQFIKVPEEYPTVFDACNAASDGDTVAVSNQLTVAGPLKIPAVDFHVLGGWNADFSNCNPTDNPTNIIGMANAPAVQFYDGCGPGTVLEGFRISGGGGLLFNGQPGTGRYGGGVFVAHSSPTLRNLEITENNAGSVLEFGIGGGLMLLDSQSTVTEVNITGNRAVQGGGIFIQGGQPVLQGCTIEDNSLWDEFSTVQNLGGGIMAAGSHLVMGDCRVAGNSGAATGGGIYQQGGQIQLTGCRIEGNTVVNSNGLSSGGGLYVMGAQAELTDIVVTGNIAQMSAGIGLVDLISLQLTGSIIHHNSAEFIGGGLEIQGWTGDDEATLTNNTIAGNTANLGGAAGMRIVAAPLVLNNNIVAFNEGSSSLANGLVLEGTVPVLTCNDIFGNDGLNFSGIDNPFGTEGNICADPLFIDLSAGNFELAEHSPCALAQAGQCGLMGAVPGDYVSSVDDEALIAPARLTIAQNYPNPFNPRTTIAFSIPREGLVHLDIYDIAGRLTRRLSSGQFAAGPHKVSWDGRNNYGRQVAAGVYFYRVEFENDTKTGRMVLIK